MDLRRFLGMERSIIAEMDFQSSDEMIYRDRVTGEIYSGRQARREIYERQSRLMDSLRRRF